MGTGDGDWAEVQAIRQQLQELAGRINQVNTHGWKPAACEIIADVYAQVSICIADMAAIIPSDLPPPQ